MQQASLCGRRGAEFMLHDGLVRSLQSQADALHSMSASKTEHLAAQRVFCCLHSREAVAGCWKTLGTGSNKGRVCPGNVPIVIYRHLLHVKELSVSVQ